MLTVTEAIDEFLLAIRAEGARPKSVACYVGVLSLLKEHCGAVVVADVTPRLLREWFAACWERGLSRESIRTYHTWLFRFFGWCAAEYDIKNPMQKIQRPRKKKLTIKAISPDDFLKMLDAARNSAYSERNVFMLFFFLDTGARRGGVAGLTLDNLDLDAGRAWVVEKGKSGRFVYFTERVAAAGRAWLAVRPETDSKHVFVSLSDAYRGRAISGKGIYSLFRELAAAAGVTENFSPHAFRHAWARQFVLNGGNDSTLQALGGWANIKHAQNYLQFREDELQQIHDEKSPLESILNEK